jgi:hypothetical protein
MKAFTTGRSRETVDEFWVVEHFPVFTQGLNGKPQHLLDPGHIPVEIGGRTQILLKPCEIRCRNFSWITPMSITSRNSSWIEPTLSNARRYN